MCFHAHIDLAILLDASGSVELKNFELMKDFVRELIPVVDEGGNNVRVGVIVFESNASVQFYLRSFKTRNDVLNAIRKIKYTEGSSTNTAVALEYMRTTMFNGTKGDRPNVDNVAILMTDGKSDNTSLTVAAARRAKEQGVTIYAIGIDNPNTVELDDIASEPLNQTRLDLSNFTQLEYLSGRFFPSVCKSDV